MIFRKKWLAASLISLVFMLGNALTLADDAVEDVTLNDMIDVIDNWYAENPDEHKTPVLVVIWNEYVEEE